MSMDKKYDEDMMAKIVAHKDFGKRNPVDIGVDCGYTENEVIEMLQALSQEKETKDEDRDNIVYVLMQKDEKFYIVSVNIDSWEAKAIKEVPQFEYVEDENEYPIYQIRKKIFAWIDGGDYKTLMWENLETGECGKILVDSNIEKFIILNDAIIMLTESEIIRDEFGKQRMKYRLKNNKEIFGSSFPFFIRSSFSLETKLIEGKDEIYIIDDENIYAVEKTLNHVKKIKYEAPDDDYYSDENDKYLFAEYTETEGLIWYLCEAYTRGYRKYTEKNLKGCDGWASVLSGISGSEYYSALLGINTENYRLIQESIVSKDWENEICKFQRMYDDETDEYGDVYVVGDKDIFISVCGDYYDKLIKIDLRNERKPVTLSVQMF